MRKNPSYTALLGPTRLLIFEKSATYMIKWTYTIIWQVRVVTLGNLGNILLKQLSLLISLQNQKSFNKIVLTFSFL